MKAKNILTAAVKSLLSEKLPQEKIDELRKEGFSLKTPTRKAALAVALYKKAENGDLSAIKELRSMLSDEQTAATQKTVVIVDDTEKNSF